MPTNRSQTLALSLSLAVALGAAGTSAVAAAAPLSYDPRLAVTYRIAADLGHGKAALQDVVSLGQAPNGGLEIRFRSGEIHQAVPYAETNLVWGMAPGRRLTLKDGPASVGGLTGLHDRIGRQVRTLEAGDPASREAAELRGELRLLGLTDAPPPEAALLAVHEVAPTRSAPAATTQKGFAALDEAIAAGAGHLSVAILEPSSGKKAPEADLAALAEHLRQRGVVLPGAPEAHFEPGQLTAYRLLQNGAQPHIAFLHGAEALEPDPFAVEAAPRDGRTAAVVVLAEHEATALGILAGATSRRGRGTLDLMSGTVALRKVDPRFKLPVVRLGRR